MGRTQGIQLFSVFSRFSLLFYPSYLQGTKPLQLYVSNASTQKSPSHPLCSRRQGGRDPGFPLCSLCGVHALCLGASSLLSPPQKQPSCCVFLPLQQMESAGFPHQALEQVTLGKAQYLFLTSPPSMNREVMLPASPCLPSQG